MDTGGNQYGTFEDAGASDALLPPRAAPATAPPRTVFINAELRNAALDYPSNVVKTTKYTPWNFLPKNLFEQFHRIANIYFAFIVVIMLIPGVSPIFPITSILPLVFVLTVTAVKEAYEDLSRARADKRINDANVLIVRGTNIVAATQKDLVPGDFVQLVSGDDVPADMIVFSSSSEDTGTCYVETSNLDGESALKLRQAVPHTMACTTPEALGALRGRVESGEPVAALEEYDGRLLLGSIHGEESDVVALNAENLLLRGSRLRNTEWVFAFVVHTGPHTKVTLNARDAPSKMSHVERRLNRLLYVVFGVLIAMCVFCAAVGVSFRVTNESGHGYLRIVSDPNRNAVYFFSDLLTFIALFNQMVPISLYVTMEFVKVASAFFIDNDLKMCDSENGIYAKARTSGIQENLGQVEHMFCDKTGTLTRNEMVLRRCSAIGTHYSNEAQLAENETALTRTAVQSDAPLREMLELMALCHTVVAADGGWGVDDGGGGGVPDRSRLQASSPDELAIVVGAAAAGVAFVGRPGPTTAVLDVLGQRQEYEILHVNAFDSVRRRMSVVVRGPDGRVRLLCKGAESAVLPLASAGASEEDRRAATAAQADVDAYANLGLRTLVTAARELDEAEYEAWASRAAVAETALVDRAEKLAEVAAEVETELRVLGALAIEDRLQDGVPEAITSLRMAGMRVWVLTGDKLETARAIGFSCSLLRTDMDVVTIGGDTPSPPSAQGGDGAGAGAGSVLIPGGGGDSGGAGDPRMVGRLLDRALAASTPAATGRGMATRRQRALIITGDFLEVALSNHATAFYKLCNACSSVLCCRCSPIQKAQVVRLAKRRGESAEMGTDTVVVGDTEEEPQSYQAAAPPGGKPQRRRDRVRRWLRPPAPLSVFGKTGPVTLAIGDGANDVSMLQEADIGVGIAGKEGRQAVMASDFSIAQFRFLTRLLLVHGRYTYLRITALILYSLYKNCAYEMPNLYFAFASGFSGQTFYDSYLMMVFNVVYTSLPVLAFAIFDKDVSEEILVRSPGLYRYTRENRGFRPAAFAPWALDVVWHSFVVYAGTMWTLLPQSPLENGQTLGLWSVGTVCLTMCILVVTLRICLETRYWTIWNHLAVWTSLVLYAGLLWPYNSIYQSVPNSMYGVWWESLSAGPFYLALILIPAVALLPNMVLAARRLWWQTDIQKEQEAAARSLQPVLEDSAGAGAGAAAASGDGVGTSVDYHHLGADEMAPLSAESKTRV